MRFYDMNIRGKNYQNDLALIKEAYKFGWDYLNLNYSADYYKEALSYYDDLVEDILAFDKNETYRNKYNDDSIAISMGINIQNANSNEIQKIARRNRDKAFLISALGGDLKVNRSVCENIKMDILSRPYYKRRDSGMNHVLAKEAARNNVAIELCFADVLHNHLKYRANLVSSFKEILMFHRKFKFPLILTTDSRSIYDIRSTRDITSFFKSIGFTDREIYNGFYYYPKEIVDLNNNRKNIIVQGVTVIEGADDFTESKTKTPTYEEYLEMNQKDSIFNQSLDEDDFEDLSLVDDFDDFDDGFDNIDIDDEFDEDISDEFDEDMADDFEEGLSDDLDSLDYENNVYEEDIL